MTECKKTIMNKYKLTGDLEDGAYASFHVGKHVRKNDKFLFKILKKKYYSLEECRGNKEVQVLQRLNHKNVLKLVEVINDDSELLMVFENFTQNVKQVLKKRDHPFSEKETQKIMYQVLEGLDYIHKMEVMHRNLRLEALSCDEQASVIKLSDFSMATSTASGQAGSYLVTPVYYVAPEVMLESGKYSSPVDIWAAGCIMAELMTGKPLIPGTSYADQMYKTATLLGVFTKGEWPEGSMLQRQVGFSLPKSPVGEGLPKFMGVSVSSDAKDLILEMVKWAPEKRKNATQCLRHDFFFGVDTMDSSMDNNQNNKQSNELLQSTEERLRRWQEKWKPSLVGSSVDEFESILSTLSPRGAPHGHGSGSFGMGSHGMGSNGGPGNDFSGGYSRQQSGKPHQNGSLSKTASRSSMLDGFDNSALIQESYSRHQERRTSRQGVQASVEEAMLQDDQLKSRKNSFNLANQPPRMESRKERLMRLNYPKYKAIYGDDNSMGAVLGATPRGGPETTNGLPQQNNKNADDYGHSGNNGNNKEMIRTRQNDFHTNNPQGEQPRKTWDQSKRLDLNASMGNENRGMPNGSVSSMDEQDVNAEEMKRKQARVERMKQENPLKYRTLYGNTDMNKPPSAQPRNTREQNKKPDLNPSMGNENRGMPNGSVSNMEEPEGQRLRQSTEVEADKEEMKRKQARLERMKQENPVKYRTLYGDTDMKRMLGGNVEDVDEPGPKNKPGSQYKPSWTEKPKQSRNQRA